ncbi:MAG: hypothetical protein ACE5JU_13870 [Candidatus Binatia bacterium]
MPTLLLKFGIVLEDYLRIDHIKGPLFHRWLPDGEKNAIELETEDLNAQLKIWFERRGFVDGSFIRFDYERREVDPEIMSRQAILDAGPLIGLLEIRNVGEEQLVPVRQNKIGDDLYKALGKRIVNKLLHPQIARFLDILRTNYGQYWIRKLESWDSRRGSLGNYCRGSLNLKWSLDNGKTWTDFVPDRSVIRADLSFGKGYDEYLTERDWQDLCKTVNDRYEPSLAAHTLARAHEFNAEGNIRYALIDGVIALEIAISEFLRRKVSTDPLFSTLSAFWNLPLRTQVVSMLAGLENISLSDANCTVKAIDLRNRVIHDSWNPPDNVGDEILGLLRTVAAFISGPEFKFPVSSSGNASMSFEHWEERYKKYAK